MFIVSRSSKLNWYIFIKIIIKQQKLVKREKYCISISMSRRIFHILYMSSGWFLFLYFLLCIFSLLLLIFFCIHTYNRFIWIPKTENQRIEYEFIQYISHGGSSNKNSFPFYFLLYFTAITSSWSSLQWKYVSLTIHKIDLHTLILNVRRIWYEENRTTTAKSERSIAMGFQESFGSN